MFWQLIRKYKCAQNDFNFDDYCFPEFQDLLIVTKNTSLIESFFIDEDYENIKPNRLVANGCFWNNNALLTFPLGVTFKNTIFLGNANFSNIIFRSKSVFQNSTFEENVNFTNTLFYDEFNCSYAQFISKVSFENSFFISNVNFENSSFNEPATFDRSKFIQNVNFDSCNFKRSRFNEVKFNGVSSFFSSKFHGLCLIERSEFRENTSFLDTQFNGRTLLTGTTFYEAVLFNYSSIFHNSDENTHNRSSIFKNINFLGTVDLSDIVLPEDFKFTQIDLRNFIFHEQQDFSDLRFIECNFAGRIRLRLKNIHRGTKLIDNLNMLFSESFYKNKESQYRGLKKSFETSRDWVFSGLAFRSEMEMKKRRLLIESIRKFSLLKLFEFLIFFFYGLFSGYTQSIFKPLFFIVLLLYFGFDFYREFYDEENAMYRSISYTIPYLDLVTPLVNEENLKVKNFGILQKILGLILIAFFILSLRKRFKQLFFNSIIDALVFT